MADNQAGRIQQFIRIRNNLQQMLLARGLPLIPPVGQLYFPQAQLQHVYHPSLIPPNNLNPSHVGAPFPFGYPVVPVHNGIPNSLMAQGQPLHYITVNPNFFGNTTTSTPTGFVSNQIKVNEDPSQLSNLPDDPHKQPVTKARTYRRNLVYPPRLRLEVTNPCQGSNVPEGLPDPPVAESNLAEVREVLESLPDPPVAKSDLSKVSEVLKDLPDPPVAESNLPEVSEILEGLMDLPVVKGNPSKGSKVLEGLPGLPVAKSNPSQAQVSESTANSTGHPYQLEFFGDHTDIPLCDFHFCNINGELPKRIIKGLGTACFVCHENVRKGIIVKGAGDYRGMQPEGSTSGDSLSAITGSEGAPVLPLNPTSDQPLDTHRYHKYQSSRRARSQRKREMAIPRSKYWKKAQENIKNTS